MRKTLIACAVMLFAVGAMGQALTGTTPANTYGDLLHLNHSNTGVDATLRLVYDGLGNGTSFSLSTNAIQIAGADSSAVTDLLINPSVKTSGNLIETQVGGVSKFSVNTAGTAAAVNVIADTLTAAVGNVSLSYKSGKISFGAQTWFGNASAGNYPAASFQFGADDSSSPIAQTVGFQGSRGGTDTNVAGVNASIVGSLGTGTATSGQVIISAGTPKMTGPAQHTAAAIGTFANIGKANVAGPAFSVGAVGAVVSSATTITPTGGTFHVTGVTPIATINLPFVGFVGPLTIIPDGVFATTLAGNIAIVSTAVVGRALIFHYDSGTSKWYPSY